MKILITSDWYIPAVNGVVTSVRNLKRGLEARGHEVRILTLSDTWRSFEKDGVMYVGSLSADALYPGARLRVASGKNWLARIMEWQPDIVHSNCEFSTFPLAQKISLELQIPLIHTYHTVYENYTHYFSPSKAWGQKLVTVFSRKVAAKTDALIAPTEKIKTLLHRYGISTPVYVLPTGIDQEKFISAEKSFDRLRVRKQLGISPEQVVLISVGRMAKEKNGGELIRIMTHFREENIQLLLVGDGPYRQELQKQAEELGVEQQVIFTGMISPETVSHYYQAGDLFVSASTSESQGLTYIEALSSGLPMLCRRDDSLQDVILENFNGWQYDSETAFVQKVRYFLEHTEQHGLLSQNAMRIAERFSISTFACHAEQIYQELIVSRKRIPQEKTNVQADDDN